LLSHFVVEHTINRTVESVWFLVKRDSFSLNWKGLLFFGRLCNGERRGGVRFNAF